METILITANDTDAGKTYVAGALARWFADRGNSVQVVKAVDCGGTGDAEFARRFAQREGITAHTLIRLPAPLAPLAEENRVEHTIDLPMVIAQLNELPPCDVRLIEGAGGIAVPIDPDGSDWRDLARSLAGCRVALVLEHRLGAINQARLSVGYLGDLPHFIVLNEAAPADEAVKASNAAALDSLGLAIGGLLFHGGEDLVVVDPERITPKQEPPKRDDSPQGRLERRRAEHRFRSLRERGPDEPLVNLADNDYLGLARHPAVVEAAAEALRLWGASASASPLITGYTAEHAALERTISDWYGGPSLVWNSGYTANQAVLGLFIAPGDLVLADRLVHNSLIAGILRSGARLIRFRHNDLSHLESLLVQHAGRRVHVVTESVYSMDGDYPELTGIAALKARHDFQWYLDEAHATGWFGPTGAGLAEAAGALDAVDLLTGTLGKALGSAGAYTVFRKSWMRDACINESGEFIYSTYLPPASAAAARAAIGIVRDSAAARPRWQEAAADFRERIAAAGHRTIAGDSPIVPVFCGEAEAALEAAAAMESAGFRVPAIRPPTVPKGGARLRISLKSNLGEAGYQGLVDALEGLERG